jgi:hypothetical protein
LASKAVAFVKQLNPIVKGNPAIPAITIRQDKCKSQVAEKAAQTK